MNQLDIASQDAAALETAPTRYIEGHGIRFAYRRIGPATGTPLVLLQHFSGNIDAWDPAVVNVLATNRPVIAFDNAGVGRSTGQTPTISLRWREMQSPSSICSASRRSICWAFPSAAASPSRSPPNMDGWSAS
jgi:pimeloyl-ACP methyl ester carboxylesterase